MMERTREHWPDHICRISFLHRLQWPPIAWPTSAHHGVAFVRMCHYTSYFFHSSQHSRTAKHPRDPLAWSWWVEQRNFWDEFGVNLQWRERLAVLNFFPHDIGWSNKHFIFVLLLITEAIQTWYQVFSPQHQTLNSSNLGFLFVGVYLWIKAILLFSPFWSEKYSTKLTLWTDIEFFKFRVSVWGFLFMNQCPLFFFLTRL